MSEQSQNFFSLEGASTSTVENMTVLKRDFPEIFEGGISENGDVSFDILPHVEEQPELDQVNYYSSEKDVLNKPILKVEHDLSTNEITKKLLFKSNIELSKDDTKNRVPFNERFSVRVTTLFSGEDIIFSVLDRFDRGTYVHLKQEDSSNIFSFSRSNYTESEWSEWSGFFNTVFAASDYLVEDYKVRYNIDTGELDLELQLV